jgi:glycosyltransferase involved in cell wall biosynthesis
MTQPMTHPRARVLWAIKGLGRGGAEQLLVSAAKVADHERFSYEVCYLLPHKDHLVPALMREGVRVHGLGQPGTRSGRAASDGLGTRPARRRRDALLWPWRLRSLLARGQYDVVHVHSPVLAAAVRVAAASLPGRAPATVYTQHNVWQSYARPTRIADLVTHRRDRRRFAVSSSVAQSNPPSLRAGTELLVHGVVRGEHGPVRARDEVRRELGIEPDAPLVVTVANLRATKDHRNLLAAARAVHDVRPDVRFALVGDGPLRAELEAERDALGLAGSVHFLGTRDDVPDLLAAADLFVMSSRHEGVPIAMLEAMAAGLPSVLTAVGGIPDVVADGLGARLVPAGDPPALAAGIVELVGDDTLRRKFGDQARELSAGFDIAAAVRTYESVYEELVTS